MSRYGGMPTPELCRLLEFEYWGIREANPEWDKSLATFLRERGLSRSQIWEELPDIAEEAGWPEPKWL